LLGWAFLITHVLAGKSVAVRHRLLCADHVANRVAIVATNGHVDWEFPAVSPRDCWQLTNGHVLFSELGGVKEVTPSWVIARRYDAPAGAQCHSCQPLPGG